MSMLVLLLNPPPRAAAALRFIYNPRLGLNGRYDDRRLVHCRGRRQVVADNILVVDVGRHVHLSPPLQLSR